MQQFDQPEKQAIEHEQQQIFQQIEDWLELPMIVLSLAWLGLFLVELTWGLTPRQLSRSDKVKLIPKILKTTDESRPATL